MIKIIIKPDSEKISNKWVPAGIIRFSSGPTLIERVERYYEVKFDTKRKADQYFLETSCERYKNNE